MSWACQTKQNCSISGKDFSIGAMSLNAKLQVKNTFYHEHNNAFHECLLFNCSHSNHSTVWCWLRKQKFTILNTFRCFYEHIFMQESYYGWDLPANKKKLGSSFVGILLHNWNFNCSLRIVSFIVICLDLYLTTRQRKYEQS